MDKTRYSAFTNFVVDKPWVALLLGILFVGAIGPGGERITSDFSYRVWFNDEDPLIRQFDAFERRFGNDENAMVIVYSPSGVFDEESATLLRRLTEELWLVHDVIRVTSLSNFNWVRSQQEPGCYEDCIADEGEPAECKEECEELMISDLIPDPSEEPWTDGLLNGREQVALTHDTLPNYLVSRDGTTAMIYASLRPAFTEAEDGTLIMKAVDNDEIVAGIDGAIEKVTGELGAGDHVFHQSGTPIMNTSFKNAAMEDMGRLGPFALGLTFAFLILIFRRISGVLLPFVVIVGTIMTTMSLSGWLGIPITNTTSMLPQILLAIAVADSVHILHSYFHALALGTERRESARYSLGKNQLPTLLTSVTTAVGFFSFAQAAIVPIGAMGILAGLGTLIAWLVTYLIMGPLLVLLPIQPKESAEQLDPDSVSPRAAAAAAFMVRSRVAIIGIFVALVVGSIVAAMNIDVNSDPFDYFPADSRLNAAADFLEEKVGGALPVEVIIDSRKEGGFKDPEWLKKAEALQQWILAKQFITSTTSIIDILKAMNRSIHGDDPAKYVIPDTPQKVAQLKFLYEQGLPQGMNINDRVPIQEDAIRITSMWSLHDSKLVLEEMDGIIAEGESRGLNAEITGKGQLWQRMNPYVVETFTTSVLIAVFAMTILLMIVFKSWRIGLLAMIPNGVPLLIGGGMLSVVGKDLDIGTVIFFSVCLGIAVDDTIHFLANYNRLRRRGFSPRKAVEIVFTHTMPALLFTTLILVSAFGTFMFASFVPNQWFGILVAFVLSAALITDGTLLPAIPAFRDSPPGNEISLDKRNIGETT